MHPSRSHDLVAGLLGGAMLIALAASGCTPPRPPPGDPEDPAISQRTQVDVANDGNVEIRSIAKLGGNEFTIVPRAGYEWSLPDCTFRVWGGGEDRLEALMRAEPRFLTSTGPRFLMCALPARDNTGRSSDAAVAVELRWRQVALGQPDLSGVTRMEFRVDRRGVMWLKRAGDPGLESGESRGGGGGGGK